MKLISLFVKSNIPNKSENLKEEVESYKNISVEL